MISIIIQFIWKLNSVLLNFISVHRKIIRTICQELRLLYYQQKHTNHSYLACWIALFLIQADFGLTSTLPKAKQHADGWCFQMGVSVLKCNKLILILILNRSLSKLNLTFVWPISVNNKIRIIRPKLRPLEWWQGFANKQNDQQTSKT